MTTGVICPTPLLQFFDNQGNPAVGGSVLTQVGGSNAATFQDVGLTTPLPNPIPLNSRGEVSTSFGASAQCFLTPNTVYAFTLYDAQGNQLWVATYVNGVQVELTQAAIGAALWPYDIRFDGAPVVDTGWPYGDPRRFGMVGDGATDDTQALNDWASGGGNLTFPDLVALITDEITVLSETTITGCRGAKIVQSVANKSIFVATSASLVTIQQMKLQQTAWGAAAYVAPIVFDGCSQCYALNNEILGHQWTGIYLTATSSSRVAGNYLHNANPLVSIAFTVAPVAGATSGTLTANWTRPDGVYAMGFTITATGLTEGKAVTLTLGAATATWAGGLSANCDAAVTIYPGINSSDITVFSSATTASSANVVDGNYCYSTTLEIGITVQDPYSGVLPTRNVVTNNRVAGHTGYGIIAYMPDSGDSYTNISNNVVYNITGEFPLNVSSGAGIYCVGTGLGGLVVANNQVNNCCSQTQTLTLTPAGIGIAGSDVNTVPIVVSGNVVGDMSQYSGIRLNGIIGGGTVIGNTVNMPAAQSSANIGHGIIAMNCDGVSITGNTINNPNTTQNVAGIALYANTADQTNIIVSDNTVNGGHSAGIRTLQTGGQVNQYLTITGNILRGGDNTCVPMLFDNTSASDVQVTGNNFQGGSGYVMSVVGCVDVRCSNNRLKGTGTVVLNTSGTCTNGFFDRSNLGVLADGHCVNAATGFIVELSNAVNTDPAAGTYAVGDTIWHSNAASGERLITVCTTAGVAGAGAAFKVMPNLS